MSVDINKIRTRLAKLVAETNKTKLLMSTAPGFNYGTSLFIGDVNSQIRVWLDNVSDIDSLVVLNGAIDAFFSKVQPNEFQFTVKRSPTNGNDVIEVGGLVLLYKLIDVKVPTDKRKVEMTLQLKSFIAQPSLEHEIKHNCYFYLNGEIEGESYPGKKYNPTQDVFEDYSGNIITAATFTSLSMYCERRNKIQELLTTVPF